MATTMPCPPVTDQPAPAAAPNPCYDPGHEPGDFAAERNRYFTGKYMTARDFADEQWYFLSRHRLHQWALHGWGIVCGLEVVRHRLECARDWVIVQPGIAIDCYGREIIVREPTPVNLTTLLRHDEPCGSSATGSPGTSPFLLGIRYGECATEPVPVLFDEAHCGTRTAANRVAEVPCFRYRTYSTDDRTCWVRPASGSQPCDFSYPSHEKGCCLKPGCPCDAIVPLVLVQPKPGSQWTGYDQLEYGGRHYVPGPLHPRTLTHICDFNWTHGGMLNWPDHPTDSQGAGTAPAHPQGEQHQGHQHQGHQHQGHHHGHQLPPLCLKVTFDRPLLPDPNRKGQAVGLDEHTFVVQYVLPGESDGKQRKQIHGHLKVVDRHNGAAAPCDKRSWSEVIFEMSPHDCTVEAMLRIKDPTVYVTLKCDFIVDVMGRAVDGNHLRGTRPTGDGVEGGTFESWFILTHEPKAEPKS